MLMFKSPVTIIFSHWFIIRFRLLENFVHELDKKLTKGDIYRTDDSCSKILQMKFHTCQVFCKIANKDKIL